MSISKKDTVLLALGAFAGAAGTTIINNIPNSLLKPKAEFVTCSSTNECVAPVIIKEKTCDSTNECSAPVYIKEKTCGSTKECSGPIVN